MKRGRSSVNFDEAELGLVPSAWWKDRTLAEKVTGKAYEFERDRSGLL
jgi:hypothetical protein